MTLHQFVQYENGTYHEIVYGMRNICKHLNQLRKLSLSLFVANGGKRGEDMGGKENEQAGKNAREREIMCDRETEKEGEGHSS